MEDEKLSQLMNNKAYFDPTHPEHAAVTQQVQEHFQAAAGGMESAGSAHPFLGRISPRILEEHPELIELNKLVRDPAYWDPKAPSHHEMKLRVKAWFDLVEQKE